MIIGVDESGLGSIAGPLTASAVALPDDLSIPGVTDSKKLSKHRRSKLADQIAQQALFWVVGSVDSHSIDHFGVHYCLQQCQRACALEALSRFPTAKLIMDGNQLIPGLPSGTNQEAIPKADSKIQAVSAASILAKVTRDFLMEQLHQLYPNYQLIKNSGYPTKDHKDLLSLHGPSPVHRTSYKPVKEVIKCQ